MIGVWFVNTYPTAKITSAKVLVCHNFKRASNTFKVGENIVRVSKSLHPDETQSYSVSHPDPSCLHGALVVLGGLRVKG